jgi:hypothetical protein
MFGGLVGEFVVGELCAWEDVGSHVSSVKISKYIFVIFLDGKETPKTKTGVRLDGSSPTGRHCDATRP